MHKHHRINKRISVYLHIKNEEPNKKFSGILQIMVSVLAILGISVTSIFSTLSNYMPCIQRKNAENIVEKVKVTESQAYIESVLGIPQKTVDFKYKDSQGTKFIGEKSFFVTKYYTFVIYYNVSNTCIGYFLIKNDKKFSPKLYLEEEIFDLEVSKSEILDLGFTCGIGHFTNRRSDGSSYHIRYSTHHLALNGCYVGLGYSNLGNIDEKSMDVVYKYSQEWNDGYFIVNNDNRNEVELLEEDFKDLKPNVFSVFLANDTYDVNDLLSQELETGLALTQIELRILK